MAPPQLAAPLALARFSNLNPFLAVDRAERHRARNELTPERDAKLRNAFAEFLENVYEKNEGRWFSSQRKTILAKLEARRSPA